MGKGIGCKIYENCGQALDTEITKEQNTITMR